MTHEVEGKRLLRLARESIIHHLGGPSPEMPVGEFYERKGACFVTITRDGELHGCIGSLEPVRPLAEDVKHNAVAAAFYDPRTRPLYSYEVDEVRIEISHLGPISPMVVADEADALRQIRPFVDGVVFAVGHRRSTFSPQVWEKLPDPAEFMAHLKMKAGLPPDFWSDAVELSRYSMEKWSEPEPKRGDVS